MNIKKVKIGKNEFEFVNMSGSRGGYGFYHYTELFLNGARIANYRCNYINRTWESYEYQTVMLCAIDSKLDRHIASLQALFMSKYDYKKMTQGRKAQFEKELVTKDPFVKTLRKLKGEIRGSNW